jgi:hypothetical protein
MLNAGNQRRRDEAQRHYVGIIAHCRRYIERHGKAESVTSMIAGLGIVASTFRLACKARPDLIQYEQRSGAVRFRFTDEAGAWSDWCDWSKPVSERSRSDDRRSRIADGLARAKARKAMAGGAKLRECLRCRSNGVKTMVLGGPGERFCEPCRRAVNEIWLGEGCSSGRRVGLSGYSIASQIQPRAA